MDGFGSPGPAGSAEEMTAPSRYGPHYTSYDPHDSPPAASWWAHGDSGGYSRQSSGVAPPINGLPSLPPSEEARGASTTHPVSCSTRSLSSSAFTGQDTHGSFPGSAGSGSHDHRSQTVDDSLPVLRSTVLVMQDEMQLLRDTLLTTVKEKEEMRQHVSRLDQEVRNLRNQVARMEAATIEARQEAVVSAARLEEMERALARFGARVHKMEKDDVDWDDEEALPMMYVRALAKGKDLARSI
jgi:hypothetical protein